MKPIEEYKSLVEVAETVDYIDKQTIRSKNKTVARMYQLVRSVAREGPEAIDELARLLDDPSAARRLAHQLVECVELPNITEDKCFAIIEELSKEDGPGGMGEKIWLREWKPKKGRT